MGAGKDIAKCRIGTTDISLQNVAVFFKKDRSVKGRRIHATTSPSPT
jgi:hypothetical protein